MLEAFLWGLLATSLLLVGGLVGCWMNISNRALGLGILEGGAVSLAMLVAVFTSNVPEAYEHGGKLAGLLAVLGFAVSVLIVVTERS